MITPNRCTPLFLLRRHHLLMLFWAVVRHHSTAALSDYKSHTVHLLESLPTASFNSQKDLQHARDNLMRFVLSSARSVRGLSLDKRQECDIGYAYFPACGTCVSSSAALQMAPRIANARFQCSVLISALRAAINHSPVPTQANGIATIILQA